MITSTENHLNKKILAILEGFALPLLLVPLLILGLYRLFPAFEIWQTATLGFPFAVFGDVIMVAVVLLALRLRGRRLAEYGIHLQNTRAQLDIAAACFIPVVLAGFPLGMGLDYRSWNGALLLIVIQTGLLVLLGLILRRKPGLSAASFSTAAGLLLLLPAQAEQSPAYQAVVLFTTYALFVGFGEEILYRGYIQTRLNEVFGKPYTFFGVPFGWGAVITALIFGLSHAGLLSWALGLRAAPTLAWSAWTFTGGLVFGLVREKSGGVLAPALLHGLPQAIASAATVLFL